MIKRLLLKIIVKCLRLFHLINYIPDKTYIKLIFYIMLCKTIDFNNPKTFNEKLQWLKIYNRKDKYTKMVDKYEVKKYVASIIGPEYIIPTYGVWQSADDIDFDCLPNQFVIKCTHDSGSAIVCNNKSDFDISYVKQKLTNNLKKNYYWNGREWPYKNVFPRIIAEKYLTNSNKEIIDYKVHCFNGDPKIILVCKDRSKGNQMTEDFFSTSWEHLNIKRPNKNNSIEVIQKPKQLNQLLTLSKKISKDTPFLRVDFYIFNEKIYFGEITFFPASGFENFVPEDWDTTMGDWININAV